MVVLSWSEKDVIAGRNHQHARRVRSQKLAAFSLCDIYRKR